MSDVPKIVKIELLDDYVLIATFDNGVVKQLDFKPLLELGRFAGLREEVWRNGKITPSAVIWTDEIDICENELWNKGIEV